MALRLPSGITLFFARHGETIANRQGRFQGRTIDTALTSLGIEQARTIARIMQRNVCDLSCLSRISSSLPRARRTMEIVLSTLGMRGDSYAIDDRIIEIDLGAWDGLTKQEARALDPAAYDARDADKWNVRSTDSRENYSDVARRATSWIRDLKTDTFAISHGAFTRILRGLLAGASWQEMSALDEPQGCVFRARESVVERLNLQDQGRAP
jgi:broad specificity phosphatase PhoE